MFLFTFHFYFSDYDYIYHYYFIINNIILYLTDDLNPVLDLNMTDVNPQMTVIWYVAPPPNYVNRNYTWQVWRVNVIQHVHQCVGWRCDLQGLLVLNNNLYVIDSNGTLAEVNINNTTAVQVYQVPNIRYMTHQGSLSYHPSVITHPDLLSLADRNKGEIFSYNVTSKNKQVHLTGLSEPTSVSFMTYNNQLYYVVCEAGHHQVHIYNSTWSLFQTLGGRGSGEAQLSYPQSAIRLPGGLVVISDVYNNSVSLFTLQARFVRHILTWSDGLSYTRAMSISLPYLWVVDNHRLYRYKLY